MEIKSSCKNIESATKLSKMIVVRLGPCTHNPLDLNVGGLTTRLTSFHGSASHPLPRPIHFRQRLTVVEVTQRQAPVATSLSHIAATSSKPLRPSHAHSHFGNKTTDVIYNSITTTPPYQVTMDKAFIFTLQKPYTIRPAFPGFPRL